LGVLQSGNIDGHRLRSFVALLQKVADFALTSAESCSMPIPRHSSGNSNTEIRGQLSAFIVICDELLVRTRKTRSCVTKKVYF